MCLVVCAYPNGGTTRGNKKKKIPHHAPASKHNSGLSPFVAGFWLNSPSSTDSRTSIGLIPKPVASSVAHQPSIVLFDCFFRSFFILLFQWSLRRSLFGRPRFLSSRALKAVHSEPCIESRVHSKSQRVQWPTSFQAAPLSDTHRRQ